MAKASTNPVINSLYLKPQHEWGWQVAVDLFLAGMGSGALIAGLLMVWLGYSPYSSNAILLWGPVSIGLGSSFLILKLGVKRRFLNAIKNPATSWLSRGFYILTGCMILGGLLLIISLLPLFGVNTRGWSTAIKELEILAFIFSVGVALYTGVLVRSVRFVSFWHTYLLPALFSVSSLTTGAAATILATYTYDSIAYSQNYSFRMRNTLIDTTEVLLLAEAIVLVCYLYTRYQATEGQATSSVRLLISGKLRFVFWPGIVTAGFILPAIFLPLYSYNPENSFFLVIGVVSALLGRLLLRLGIIYAGIKDQTPLHKFIEVQYYMKFPEAGVIPL